MGRVFRGERANARQQSSIISKRLDPVAQSAGEFAAVAELLFSRLINAGGRSLDVGVLALVANAGVVPEKFLVTARENSGVAEPVDAVGSLVGLG